MELTFGGLGTASDIIIAISTVVYTTGTFLLWRVTKVNTDLLSAQIKVLQAQELRSASFNRVVVDNSIVDAHREVWGLVLSTPKLFDLLTAKSEPLSENVVAAEWLGSILINHCARIHLAHHEKIYTENDLDAFARDARSLFGYPLVRWRWRSVAKYHTKDFRDFVEKMIEA